MRLTFLGAAETVTGSKFLLEDERWKLLVDYGLFQGDADLRERNWRTPAFHPRALNAVLLTHAHIDHSGGIPRLVRDGFQGAIYCSEATADLCGILLPDSGRIQEDDAELANRYGYSRHAPALPLYTEADARACLPQFHPVGYGTPRALSDEISFTLSRAGHILGSSFVQLRIGDGTTIVFTGDIGRPNSPIMKPPAQLQDADHLVLECTYGDRKHGPEYPREQIGAVIRRTAARGGTTVIPAFAVGRTQDLLYHLHSLKQTGDIPEIPIFLDSPMAIDATELLLRHINEHQLAPQACVNICGIARYARRADESKAINASPMPKVIVSASGMATGGRVLHHLKHYVGDTRNTVLLAGYQAPGTRSDRLVRGETSLKIHGRDWPVRAEIMQLDNMSAHADYSEILDWLKNFRAPPRKVFLVHGEPAAARAMQQHIIESLGWTCIIPRHGQSVDL